MSASRAPTPPASRSPAVLPVAVTLALSAAAVLQRGIELLQDGTLQASTRWQAALAIGVAGIAVEAVLLWVLARGRAPRLDGWIQRALMGPGRRSPVDPVLFVGIVVGFPLLLLGPCGRYFTGVWPRAFVFWILAAAGAARLQRFGMQGRFPGACAAVALAMGVVYKAATYLPDISAYPFSLGWSEASRYYYASLWFSPSLYGARVPLSPMHPSRYLLQSVPFLIASLPLWVHRLWQVALWISLNAGTAWLLARRLQIPGRLERWLFGGWCFLFLFQGPVYYHLLLCAIPVLWAFDRARPWRTFAVVVAASIWAGLSRINWAPVPGILAATLFWLESDSSGGLRRQWVRPAAWIGIGTLMALLANLIYALNSGNDLGAFSTSFTSDLLWGRLLPGPTYAPGVLLGVLLASTPVGIDLARRIRGLPMREAWPRALGLAGGLFVLFAGGLVVSTKIGGGGNLHNMDAFLLLLMVIAGFVFWGRSDLSAGAASGPRGTPAPLLTAAVAIPIVFALGLGGPVRGWSRPVAQHALGSIRSAVADEIARGGEVLFLSERHLVTFRTVGPVPLVAEYEKVLLMEMAMAGSESYLQAFRDDLRTGRFGLIVSEPLHLQYQGRAHAFGEENDVWVREVAEPLAQYYRPALRLDEVGIWLMVPAESPQSEAGALAGSFGAGGG